jgi:multimeric flavodoxin WrbA
MKQKQITVLGIVGSPRKNGNTEQLVDELLKGAETAGAKKEKILLNELKITPCQGCGYCGKTGKCKIEDDMKKINERMTDSEIFIFGTPVYFWGPTGQFKCFYDRLLGTAKLGIINGKQVILAIPLGGSERIAGYTIGMLTDATEYLGAEIVAKIVSPNTGAKGVISNNQELMIKARNVGRTVIEQKSRKK